MTTYKIVRFYQDEAFLPEVIDTGLTLAQAQEYCHHPETSSTTATSHWAVSRTKHFGPWFEGYEEER